ncbi:MAG: hypothetical protein HQK89_16190 [Nitrospirae bacterium]|nr:hypothetical protein [Nitrospirota bacterium]
MPFIKETDFVDAGDGTPDFGWIDKDVAGAIGGKEAPIRLQMGNDDYGKIHLEKHSKEFVDNG